MRPVLLEILKVDLEPEVVLDRDFAIGDERLRVAIHRASRARAVGRSGSGGRGGDRTEIARVHVRRRSGSGGRDGRGEVRSSRWMKVRRRMSRRHWHPGLRMRLVRWGRGYSGGMSVLRGRDNVRSHRPMRLLIHVFGTRVILNTMQSIDDL